MKIDHVALYVRDLEGAKDFFYGAQNEAFIDEVGGFE